MTTASQRDHSAPEPKPAKVRTFGATPCPPCRRELGNEPVISDWTIASSQHSTLLEDVRTVEATCDRCHNVLTFTKREGTPLGRLLVKAITATLETLKARDADEATPNSSQQVSA